MRKQFRFDEEFKVGLLINISFAWAPTVNIILTLSSVNGGLRVNGKETEFIYLRQLHGDDRCFFRWCLVTPWECRQLFSTEFREQCGDIFKALRLAPELECIFFLR